MKGCANSGIGGNLSARNFPPFGRFPTGCGGESAPRYHPRNDRARRNAAVVSFRKVVNGILFVLRTGCQWKAVPGHFGSASTVHRRFQQWVKAGIIDEFVGVMIN